MTATVDRTALTRRVHFHDPHAPAATVVVPSVFVAVRSWDGRLLLVRRIDSGCWELPAGRVDVGESAEAAAVRETLEEAGVKVVVTGLIGLFTDPGHVVRASDERSGSSSPCCSAPGQSEVSTASEPGRQHLHR